MPGATSTAWLPHPEAQINVNGVPVELTAEVGSVKERQRPEATPMNQRLIAILPCNDLDAAQAFFERLGFRVDAGSLDDYRMLSDGLGAEIHLNPAVEGWLTPGRNPFCLYLYREDVDGAASAFTGELVAKPKDRPWGMYEFSLNGPDETLVRVGWPTRLRSRAG